MKKFTHCFVALLLVVSFLCMLSVSSMALSDTLKHVYDSGYLQYLNGTYRYSIDTAASTTLAYASLSFGKAARLTAQIKASLVLGNDIQLIQDYEVIQDTVAYASVTNVVYQSGVPVSGKITAAASTYRIGTIASFDYLVE